MMDKNRIEEIIEKKKNEIIEQAAKDAKSSEQSGRFKTNNLRVTLIVEPLRAVEGGLK